MQSQKNQLEEDLTAMTNRADQAELDSSTKQKRIEKLVKENKILDQQLKNTQEELDRLKGKVIYLEEEKIPMLAADFKRQLRDFQDERKRETEKPMADFRKTMENGTYNRSTHRFSSPSVFGSSVGFWPKQKEELALPLLGKDHPKLRETDQKTGQRVMIT